MSKYLFVYSFVYILNNTGYVIKVGSHQRREKNRSSCKAVADFKKKKMSNTFPIICTPDDISHK